MRQALELWKTCGRSVQNLLTKRQQKYISASRAQKSRARALCTRFRGRLRLIARVGRVESRHSPQSQPTLRTLTADVHRFEQSIAGRLYLIEVSAVSQDRWRAVIVRLPGVPTAMMPFYGRTPAEAAEQLSAWLTRAYQRASSPSSTV